MDRGHGVARCPPYDCAHVLFSRWSAKASAMYAPELRGNSDEMKVTIED